MPPEAEQLAAVESDAERFADELRPDLVVRAIGELQAAGVEPDVWKVEGLNTADDYRAVAAAARAGGRDGVGCVVLGAGADEATVAHWLREAAGVDGFIGFAIGRTIFWDALRGWLDGRIDRPTAVEAIAANYRATVELYTAARLPDHVMHIRSSQMCGARVMCPRGLRDWARNLSRPLRRRSEGNG